jgi:hypothetical protein
MEPAGGVDRGGQSEAVELTQEVTGRCPLVRLVGGRRLDQGRVQDEGARSGEEQRVGFAVPAPYDLAAAWVGCLPGETGGPDGGPVLPVPRS